MPLLILDTIPLARCRLRSQHGLDIPRGNVWVGDASYFSTEVYFLRDEAKLSTLREMLQEHDIEAVLVSNSTNIFYLTGFRGLEPQEREAYVLVTPDAGATCGDPLAVP